MRWEKMILFLSSKIGRSRASHERFFKKVGACVGKKLTRFLRVKWQMSGMVLTMIAHGGAKQLCERKRNCQVSPRLEMDGVEMTVCGVE